MNILPNQSDNEKKQASNIMDQKKKNTVKITVHNI